MTGEYVWLYWEGLPWHSRYSTSDASSSDDYCEHDVYSSADDIIAVNGKIKKDPEGDYNAMADGFFPGSRQVPDRSTDCEIGDELADRFLEPSTTSRNSNSPSSSQSGTDDMVALLSQNKSPKVVFLLQGCEEEWNRKPPLEGTFMLESAMGHTGDSLGDDLY